MTTHMKTHPMIHPRTLAVALCATLAAACATTGTNEHLEAARVEVNTAAMNPDVIARAPLELRTAQEALGRGDSALRNGEEFAEVEHDAYLARVRAQTALDLARARRDTDEMTRVQAEVDRLRLAARTREAASARADASAARTEAAIASRQAAAASEQARIAAQQAQSANQVADIERARAAQASADADEARRRAGVLVLELQARETERGLLVTLGDVLFATGRAELLPVAMPRLDKLAAFLNQFPEKTLVIEGHTDSVGGERYNQELSERRAEAVRAALAARGVNPSRMAASGCGKAFPVASNGTPEGRQMNRRVEVVVSDEHGNPRPRLGALSR